MYYVQHHIWKDIFHQFVSNLTSLPEEQLGTFYNKLIMWVVLTAEFEFTFRRSQIAMIFERDWRNFSNMIWYITSVHDEKKPFKCGICDQWPQLFSKEWNEQSISHHIVILWVNWIKNESFWHRCEPILFSYYDTLQKPMKIIRNLNVRKKSACSCALCERLWPDKVRWSVWSSLKGKTKYFFLICEEGFWGHSQTPWTRFYSLLTHFTFVKGFL